MAECDRFTIIFDRHLVCGEYEKLSPYDSGYQLHKLFGNHRIKFDIYFQPLLIFSNDVEMDSP